MFWYIWGFIFSKVLSTFTPGMSALSHMLHRADVTIIVPTLWTREVKLGEAQCVRDHTKNSPVVCIQSWWRTNTLYYSSANTRNLIFPIFLNIFPVRCLQWSNPRTILVISSPFTGSSKFFSMQHSTKD